MNGPSALYLMRMDWHASHLFKSWMTILKWSRLKTALQHSMGDLSRTCGSSEGLSQAPQHSDVLQHEEACRLQAARVSDWSLLPDPSKRHVVQSIPSSLPSIERPGAALGLLSYILTLELYSLALGAGATLSLFMCPPFCFLKRPFAIFT